MLPARQVTSKDMKKSDSDDFDTPSCCQEVKDSPEKIGTKCSENVVGQGYSRSPPALAFFLVSANP